MSRRVRAVCLLMLVFSLFVVQSYAASVSGMTDENTYIDEDGSIYTYQNDKVYQLIDGQLYEVVNGNQQSIIDVMKQRPGSEVPDADVMVETQSIVGRTIGLALSVIIYVFFAMTAFTTACDLAYIGIPAIRPVMFDGAGGTANLHQSVMHGLAQSQMNSAQNAAMRGDMGRAAALQNSAMRSEAEGQYRDQNWFGNREAVERASGRSGGRCFISRELRSIVAAGQISGYSNAQAGVQFGQANPNITVTYLKRRIVSIVLIIAVFMLLVTSTVFTDFGFDIGNMIYRTAAKFLGF